MVAGCLAAVAAAAEEAALEPVTVTAPRLERPLAETPAAVTRVDGEQRRGRRGVTLDEGLEAVPGVFFQNRHNFAQGLRISSRGFGARAAFGIRGLRLRVDGLPLTLPDGQSQVDTIDLDSVTSVEVRRGPASVLYGNATGGVIDLRTAEGFAMARSPVVSMQAGSFGRRKANVRAGGTSGDWAYHASGTPLSVGGHRDQSAVAKRLGRVSVTRLFAGGRELRLIAGAMDTPFAEDPGGLTRRVDTRKHVCERCADRVVPLAGQAGVIPTPGHAIDVVGGGELDVDRAGRGLQVDVVFDSIARRQFVPVSFRVEDIVYHLPVGSNRNISEGLLGLVRGDQNDRPVVACDFGLRTDGHRQRVGSLAPTAQGADEQSHGRSLAVGHRQSPEDHVPPRCRQRAQIPR